MLRLSVVRFHLGLQLVATVSATMGSAVLLREDCRTHHSFMLQFEVMRAYIFYTTGDDTEEKAQYLADELTLRKVEVHNLDADSREGAPIADLYDITRRPSAVVTRDDGGMVHRWLGMLPAAGDISYYVNSL